MCVCTRSVCGCVDLSVLREDVGGHEEQSGLCMGYIVVPSEENPIVYEHVGNALGPLMA